MKKILITGITGQDGIFLTSLLKKNYLDCEIIGISRNKNNKDFLKNLNFLGCKNMENIKFLKLDLLNFNEVNNTIRDFHPDFVYNLSGPSSVYDSIKNPFFENEIKIIFKNLTEALLKNNNLCNFFQASSSEMFGKQENTTLNESSEFFPNSPYAKGKLNNHLLVKDYHEKYNWKIFSGIMFNHESIFRSNHYLIMKIIENVIDISKNKKNKLTIGSLTYERDWSYAGDVVDAIYNIANNGKSYTYVIGSGKSYTIKNILEIIFFRFNLNWEKFTEVNTQILRKGDPEKVTSNPKKIKLDLNWSVKKPFEETIFEIIDFKLNQKSFDD